MHLRNCRRIASFALFLAVITAPAAAADRRIAVRPVEAYNAADLESSLPGLQSAAASRLSASGLQVTTLKAGESAAGDWAVRLTLTRVGSRISIDGAAEPVAGKGDVIRAYEVAESSDNLLPSLTTVITSLRKAITAAPVPVAQPSAPPAPAAPTVAAPASPAPAAISSPSAPVPPQSPTAPLLSAPPSPPTEAGPLARALATYRVGEAIPGQALSLAVADVDGDGVNELLVLTATEILAFRDDGRDMKLRWRSPVGKKISPSVISVGDINHDGTPEVFVAGLLSGAPATEIYQRTSGALAPQGPVVFAFLRALTHPEQGLVLLGMTSDAGKGLFGPKIRSFAWVDGGYKDQGAFAGAPAGPVTDLDWHRFKNGERPWIVQTTQGDKLRVIDADGKVLFTGPEDVKGSENVLESGDQGQQDRLDSEVVRVQGKTLLWRDSSGTSHLILQKNHTLTTFFRRARSYSKAQLVSFQWGGLGLTSSGQSPIIPGYLADIGLAPNPLRPGATTVYGLLNQSEGLVIKDKTIRLLAWDL